MSSGAQNLPQASAEAEVKRLQAELAAANERWQRLAAEYSANEARQRTLARLTHQLAGIRQEADAARLLECACRDLFQYDAFLLDAYDVSWDLVQNVLSLDTIEGVLQEVPPAFSNTVPGPLGRKVITEGAQLILRQPGSQEDNGLKPYGDKARRSLSLMFAPVRNGAKILGTLSVQSYRPNAYMQSDLDLLQVTADLCGGAFERLRTEAELHAKEQQYQEIVESTQEGIWVVNAKGLTTFVNRRMGEMLGYAPEEMLGKASFDFMFPEDLAKVSADIAEERRKPHRQLDLRLRRKNGSVLWALVTSNPMQDAAGKFSGTVGLLSDITERKEMEEELRESESRFQAFMDNLSGFAFIKDDESRYIFVNSTWEKVFGRKLESVMGLKDAELFPQISARIYEGSDAALREKKAPIQVLETIYHGSEPREYLVSKFLIPGERGGEELVGGVAVDVTAGRAAEAELRRTQRRFQAFMDNLSGLAFIKDSQGRYVFVNQVWERLFTDQLPLALGKTDEEVFPPETAAQFRKNDAELRRLGKPQQVLEAVQQEDGLHTYFVSKFPIPGEQEGEFLVGGIALDVTERLRVQEQLLASEARSQAILNSALDAVVTIDGKGCIVEFNPAAEKMFGHRREDALGKNMGELIVPPELRARHQQALERCVASGNSSILGKLIELPALKADGSQFPAELTINRVAHGTQPLFTGFIRDISARKAAEQEIRQLNANLEKRVAERTHELQVTNKELESFCYSVSHDLRAPLRAIDGFSQALEEDYAAMMDADGKSYLDRVRKATKRMSGLIDDLLELSRIARAELKQQPVDLTQIARLVIEELGHGHPDRKVEWIIATQLPAHGDPRLLRIVLDNLLGNAWKFTRNQPQPRIEFGMTPKEGKTVYFVRDNGAGFDMNYASKLFGVFQRLHSANEYEGTGVGLANVQRVIHRHGGSVWAEAKVNEGATFYFTLPEAEQTS